MSYGEEDVSHGEEVLCEEEEDVCVEKQLTSEVPPSACACSVSGFVVDGSNALLSCAAELSVPEREYSVGSVSMLSLSWEFLRGWERIGVVW